MAVVVISVFIPFLGRTAIGWIVDVTTLGATLIYGLICHAVFRSAQRAKQRLEQVTGAAGFLLMVCFGLLLLIPGLLPFHAMETESYVLFIVWAVLGLIYFRVLIRRDGHREYGQRIVVWIILLVLVLFASMMWVSRATESAVNEAVEHIIEYHESHPADDSDLGVRGERAAFLKEQAKAISRTNTMYSTVSLGLFMLIISMMLNNYRETQKLGQRLTEAENEADHAENGKIAVEMFGKSAPGTYDAILMDVRMPEMDGLEAAAAIRAISRQDAKRIPIIALTANAFDEDVQRSLQAGMNAHLTKPIDPSNLYQALGELIYEAESSA